MAFPTLTEVLNTYRRLSYQQLVFIIACSLLGGYLVKSCAAFIMQKGEQATQAFVERKQREQEALFAKFPHCDASYARTDGYDVFLVICPQEDRIQVLEVTITGARIIRIYETTTGAR